MDPVIIAAIIGAAAVIASAAIAAWKWRPSSNVEGRQKEQKVYSWDEIHGGLIKIIKELEVRRFDPEVIVTVAGSGGIVANWFKKIMEERGQRRYPLFNVLLQRNDETWRVQPPDHQRVEVARWLLHIPKSLAKLPTSTRIVVVDSTFVGGTTIRAIRKFFEENGFDSVLVACLVRIEQPGDAVPRPPDIVVFESDTANFVYPWGPAS